MTFSPDPPEEPAPPSPQEPVPRDAMPRDPFPQEPPELRPRPPRPDRLIPPELLTDRAREDRRIRNRGNISLKVIALVAFVFGVGLHACVALSILEDEETGATAVEPSATRQAEDDATPTGTPEIQPTPTPLPDRTSCDEIRGTQYRSVTEREFFLANCIQQQPAAPTNAPGATATQPPG